MGTGGGDAPGCYDDSSNSSSSLRNAVRRNTVSQMACDSSTRILEHQKNVARCLLLRQKRMLRSQLMTRMAEAQRIKTSNPGQTVKGDETFDDALMTSSKELDSMAEEYNRIEVVINPYPITPRPKHNVSNVSPKANHKKARRRLKLQHISLDLDELPVEQTRPRPHGSEGQSPRASLTRLPSLSTPWVAPQGDGEAGDGVWVGHPEAINSVRRTLRPAKMAEVRLLRRTQSLREPSVFGSSRRGSEDLEEGSKSKYPPLRSFSLGDDKTGLERRVVSLALQEKRRSLSLRLARDEGLCRESLFQRKSWRKGGKGDGGCYAWVEVNAGGQVERGHDGSLSGWGGRLPPILSATLERRELKEEEEDEEEEERKEISVEGLISVSKETVS